MRKIKTTILFLLFATMWSNVFAQDSVLKVEDNIRKFDYYFYEAINAKMQNKHDVAFDLLTYCLALDSTNANVHHELGNYYYSVLDKKSYAMDFFRKAAELDKDNSQYAITYASICFEEEQYSDAIEIFERLSKESPENTDLYIYLSEAYRQYGDLPKAIQTLDKLEVIVGLNEKVSLKKFQLYTSLKQEKKAFAEIQKYVDKYPTEMKYYLLLGNLYLQADKLKEALAIYTKAKELDVEDPYLISSMAEYYEKVDNKPAAEKELRTALVSPKMDVETKLSVLTQYVATLYQSKKDTQAANALFDTLMVQHPQEPQLSLMYGNLLLLQGKKDDARFQFQLFAEANPTNPTGWEQMLSTAFPDSLALVVEICTSAISYIPDLPQFYFYKGISEYMLGGHSEALETLQTGVQYVDEANKPLLSDFYGQIGDLHYNMEQKDSAYISYEKALRLSPSNIGVLNNYSYYLSLEKKDLDKAEKMSALTVKAEPTNPTYLDTYGWVLFQQEAYLMSKIYMEKAIEYSKEKGDKISSEVLEHYGDVLYMTDEKEKAVEYWIKAKEETATEDKNQSRKSSTLDRKIETKTYITE